MSIQNVLIIDDEPDIRELLTITLSRMKLQASAAEDIASAKTLLQQQTFDLCLTDMRLPDGNGLEIVEYIQRHHPDLPVAVITAYGNVEVAVQALKSGAFDFVSKPVNLEILRDLIQSALKLSSNATQQNTATSPSKLLGNSEPMQQLRKTIQKVARSQAPIYIHGESGSGKELVAREIHNAGPRRERPFIPVNCGAIPSELMESEFFGHKKGSFSGAISNSDGLFYSANGGTLFLDEVADLPLSMQVKLLRAIQERAIKPVGSHTEIPVDVRILSATHKNLVEEVENGRFRQDLFYRLNVIEVQTPPLRERTEDIAMLARFFIQDITQSWHTSNKSLSDSALEKLSQYDYPGNVRELENILERSITLTEAPVIQAEDIELPDNNHSAKKSPSNTQPLNNLQAKLANQEREAILAALEATRWNQTAAAKKLGMTLRQLRYRVDKFGIE